jgi:hypothetical protein
MGTFQKTVLLAMLSLWAAGASAQSETEKARLGRTLYIAFQCATYASLAEKKDEHERLFTLGIDSGRKFLKAVVNNEVSREAVSSVVPVGVTLLLQGPSEDFILGRIFESATGNAYESVTQRDDAGLPMPLDKWITDKRLQQVIAENRYSRANCDLVR